MCCWSIYFFFFFQAEDGIRDRDGWLEFRRVLFRSNQAVDDGPKLAQFLSCFLLYTTVSKRCGLVACYGIWAPAEILLWLFTVRHQLLRIFALPAHFKQRRSRLWTAKLYSSVKKEFTILKMRGCLIWFMRDSFNKTVTWIIWGVTTNSGCR